MRLSKVKLSGFKSFVDPTTILLPSNLVGVVGPNGCGKSNVIDAIRWVMGESSAKNLRGESMADVIFNGSGNRKPIGTASIELVFDNADGTIGGQFANYGEVSVRRTVTRDGTSQYFLNNVRCRRKDITAIFLGTGLGPRSYAIIEQGMISRLIEAKPEEMRAHLEEAAGISKYKERRRETENRIRHTRDNLDRLNDLRDEIANQLQHLQKQARAAERHKSLTADRRQFEAELLGLKLQGIDANIAKENLTLQQQNTSLESAVAAQRHIEAEIEKARQQQILTSDELNATTARHYSVDLEISHLEQSIEHNRATRERQELDLSEARERLNELSTEISNDEAQLKQLDDQLEQLSPGLADLQTAFSSSNSQRERSEGALAAWQANWDELSRELNDAKRVEEVETARIEQLQDKERELLSRLESVQKEQQGISVDLLETSLADLIRDEGEFAQIEQSVASKLHDTVQNLEVLNEQEEANSVELRQTRGQLETARARAVALETLQAAALGGDEDKAADWLQKHNLSNRPRLAQKMEVNRTWQLAVESVLGEFLQAVAVDKVDPFVSRLPDASVLLFEDDPLKYQSDGEAGTLLAEVNNAGPAAEMLARVRVANTLDEALAIRGRLNQGESVITPDGVWLSRTWARVSRNDAEAGGVLSRAEDLRALAGQIRTMEKQLQHLENQRAKLRGEIETQEQVQRDMHEEHGHAGKEHAAAAVRLTSLRSEIEKSRHRSMVLGEDNRNIDQTIDNVRQSIREADARIKQAGQQLAELASKAEGLEARHTELVQEVNDARQKAEAEREAYHAMTVQVQSQRSSRESATVTLERALSQRAQLSERVATISAHLSDGGAPLEEFQRKLQEQLALKVTVDEELRGKHELLEQANNSLREQEGLRHEKEQLVAEAREIVDTARMTVRELEVRREAIAERFEATGLNLEEVLAELPEECTAEAWQDRVEKIQRSLDRIGTVNLLAIEEFEEQSERAKYLEEQNEDLTKALETLETAIRKIDRETKARFQEVFDKVNAGLQRLFPRLFGGGHAYMSLDSDDLLNAGVTVMAQPPGKRNSSIQLLSGGEKALTAVALVFSIFELNPAPFCLLDEVDAPLDDANVSRFCEIVKEMSAQVQFLFITHNKVTMELANQLMGVTMGEPGVSRLVSVDIEEAVKLAG